MSDTPITDMAFAERANYAHTEDWLVSLRDRMRYLERTRPEVAPEITAVLRDLCYVPGHYEEIRHLNYCRWCHYVEGHQHGDGCVMKLCEPQSSGS